MAAPSSTPASHRRPAGALRLSQNPEADELLSGDPLALLIGMVLDQQVPLEWAFAAPLELRRRLGRNLDAAEIAATDPEQLVAVFSQKPALHRYPGSMAKRVHALCKALVEHYGGRAERVWEQPESGAQLLTRLRGLPGFGEQKAKIFVALLGKQFDVRHRGGKRPALPTASRGASGRRPTSWTTPPWPRSEPSNKT